MVFRDRSWTRGLALVAMCVPACLLGSPGVARAEAEFGKVAIHIERNVVDHDAEAVLEATAEGEGLAMLSVVAPDGRTVASFKAPDSKLGMRHVSLESPEPKDAARILADFPPGAYKFTGSTVRGAKLTGQATLSHKFPTAATLLEPSPGKKDVGIKGLVIRWSQVEGVASWDVVVEQEDTGRIIKASLAGDATELAVPDGFLTPETEYTVGIGAVSQDGNASFVEAAFTTAKAR